MNRALGTLRALVRTPLWWSAKLLPLIAATELAALVAGVGAADGVPRVVATLVSAIGVAAAAHVVNDLADLGSDRAAGKESVTASSSVGARTLVLAACAAAAVLPWTVVPLDPAAGAVLVGLVVLSGTYSLPPIRLKARGGAGVAADALVAHALPTAFAFLQLGAAGSRGALWWVTATAAVVWAGAFGVRNIVVHQVLDRDGDRAAGVGTFVVTRGVPRALRLGRDAVAVEVLALGVLWAAVFRVNLWLGVAFVVHAAMWLHHRRFDAPPIDTVPTTPGAWLPLSEFYEVWPALGFGIVLVVRDPGWAWALGAIVVVFAPAILRQARSFGEQLGELMHECVALFRRRIGMKPVWAAYRGFWRLGRAYWRARHAVIDPVLVVLRRNGRRLRRRLPGRHRTHP